VDGFKTIKISKSKWLKLKVMAAKNEKSLQGIMDEAIALYLKTVKEAK